MKVIINVEGKFGDLLTTLLSKEGQEKADVKTLELTTDQMRHVGNSIEFTASEYKVFLVEKE